MKLSTGEVLMGVDIETTASSLAKGAGLIQLGLALAGGPSFVTDVRPYGYPGPDGQGNYTYVDPESMKVHGISRERILQAPLPLYAGEAARAFLQEQGFTKNRQLIPVGWNVAGFDMPFINAQLVGLEGYFSYRTVDLNALCFALDGVGEYSWDSWKEHSKLYAANALGVKKEHDAGWDAQAALLSYAYLRNVTLRLEARAA